jgi:hypothetical protein
MICICTVEHELVKTFRRLLSGRRFYRQFTDPIAVQYNQKGTISWSMGLTGEGYHVCARSVSAFVVVLTGERPAVIGSKRRRSKHYTFEYGSTKEMHPDTIHSRFPGTRIKRQHMATVRTTNMISIVNERLFSVFRTNGSLILLKSKNVYSL